MLWRNSSVIGLALSRQHVRSLSHEALRHNARQVPAAQPQIVAILIRLIVFGAYRRRPKQPRQFAIGANDLAIDRVGQEVREAAAFRKPAHARAAQSSALSERAAKDQSF